MTTRKVTAIEEKVLALAVEWAEKREAWEKESKSSPFGGSLTPAAEELFSAERSFAWVVLKEAGRLLKQRRAKGEKK